MPQADTFHGFVLWSLFWLSGLGPLLVMLYIPIGLAWIIGYGIYLGIKRLTARPIPLQHEASNGQR